jgi:hypothetical protein
MVVKVGASEVVVGMPSCLFRAHGLVLVDGDLGIRFSS